ncbi:DUF4878 domain-containing protein [Flavobacterium psychrotrophum]|uniref:DUF4878 domain-containing protein n=1 Tax=Flavobacterium psychrotrophum TaxID=2294119 RepID=UPI000E311CB4|nr:DUF4878 domain-containing protein [Flavobacterium psychrotrophum]
MKKIIAVFAFLALAMVVSCSGGNGPEDVAKKFLDATNTGEFGEAKKYADEKTGQMLGMVEGMMPPDKKAEMKKKAPTVEIISSEEQDSIATVKYKLKGEGQGDEEKTLSLKKEKGDWKVTINKEDKNKEGAPGAVPPPPAPTEATDTITAPVADTAVAPAQ